MIGSRGSHDGFSQRKTGVSGMTALMEMIRKLFSRRRPAYAYAPVRANRPRRGRRE